MLPSHSGVPAFRLLQCSAWFESRGSVVEAADAKQLNVLFIISDDLTSTALSCYGNKVCSTPNIDRLAARGTRYTRAYCQGTYCGPSRASFMSGYYPHATGVLGYISLRKAIAIESDPGAALQEQRLLHIASHKIFHMGVLRRISVIDGADDLISWTERFNSQGPEWKAAGDTDFLKATRTARSPSEVNTFLSHRRGGRWR